ncbi:hypothetical protein SNE40_003965 [Patella caerulea]|uniref:Uncharacterized protein n=1 Tax=Patella caerulea TaxID=87958 RepID=A0AAN8Q990_PATCE
MRGLRKRTHTFYQRCHVKYPEKLLESTTGTPTDCDIPSASTADLGNISDTNILPSYDDMGSGSRKQLRSRPTKTKDDVSNNMDTIEGNKIINIEKLLDMWNSVIKLHFQLEEEACLMPNYIYGKVWGAFVWNCCGEKILGF